MNITELNSATYYNKYGHWYEEYQSYFHNRYLLNKWISNIDYCMNLIGGTGRVIDFGCGTGLITKMLLHYDIEITAIDISNVMLNNLRHSLPRRSRRRINFINGGVEALKHLPGKYDAIFESSVLHHLDNYEGYIKTSASKLNDIGVIYIGREPNVSSNSNPSGIYKVMDKLLRIVDLALWKYSMIGKHKEVLDKSILPWWDDGGVSLQKVLDTFKSLNISYSVLDEYKWRKCPLIYKFNHMFDSKKFGRTFYDVVGIKR